MQGLPITIALSMTYLVSFHHARIKGPAKVPFPMKGLVVHPGSIDPSDSQLMTFYLDKAELRLPPSVTFDIPVIVKKKKIIITLAL
jgi:hypothetical protein